MTDVLIPADLLAIGLAWVDPAEEGDWQERAACAETDPEAFFPEKGASTRPAKRICSRCPVRTPCLEYALARPEAHGIWGGKSTRELRQLRAQLGSAGQNLGPSGASHDYGADRLTA